MANLLIVDKTIRDIKCSIMGCDKKFATDLDMKKHMYSVHSITQKMLKQKKFATESNDPGVFPMKNGRFGCGLCSKTFCIKGAATRHYRDQHKIDQDRQMFSKISQK